MEQANIDLLYQFILATAAEADEWKDRELGEIHLLKYAYLGDLAHAEAFGGKTFTGTAWRLYHFGPWSAPAHDRISPALGAVGATVRTFPRPGLDGEGVRWVVHDKNLALKLDRQIPHRVAHRLKRHIRDFGSDTKELLHFVYRTQPMVRAAPNEELEFQAEPSSAYVVREEALPLAHARTARQQKKRREAIQRLREGVRERLGAGSRQKLIPPKLPPRYDDVFEEGTSWLDSLGAVEIQEQEGRLTFSDEVWKSAWRGDSDDESIS